MLCTLFITGDTSIAVYPESDRRKDVLKCKRAVEKFELDAQLSWLSRIGDDGYVYLMLADNAYVDRDIDDFRQDFKRISQIFNVGDCNEFDATTLCGGVINLAIRSGRVVERKGWVEWDDIDPEESIDVKDGI